MIIAVDFDGTIVEHRFPRIGAPVPYAETVLKKCIERGDQIILWTVRSSTTLREAVDYFNKKCIDLYGVNQNDYQRYWSGSPKAYAEIYIDDAALGCPLIEFDDGRRPMVDWLEVAKILEIDMDGE